MSAIARLAAIAQHTAPVLRASVPARFAPHPTAARDGGGHGDAEGWDVEEQWLEQSPTLPAPVLHERSADDVRQTRQRSSSDAAGAPPRSEALPSSSSTASSAPSARVERVVEEHHHHHVVADARLRPDPPALAPHRQQLADHSNGAPTTESGRTSAAQSAPPSRPSTVPSLTPAAPQQRRAAPERLAPAAASIARRAVETRAVHDPPPPVHITIGRIEIVANQPAPPPAARPAAPVRERPGPDLVSYLKDHR